MRRANSPSEFEGRENGSALIIVLLFVILLTVIIITFLARSMTAVRVSASSAGEAKASLLATTAGNIVIGDLKQEIIAGSTSTGTASWPVYIPTSNATMIPFRNGVPTTAPLIPNLIKRSVRSGNTGASPYAAYSTLYTTATVPPASRAANDATASKVSSLTPSLNGRFVSAAQWNSHYLIPRDPAVDTAGSTGSDSTPATTFVVPDWVVVTRQGANAVTWNSTLTDATLSNSNYAVGRFAYAVYNEGGLLDMNAAGYPADPTAGGANGLTAVQISKKGSLALADLTQLTAGTVSLTQGQVNNIVAWRNYASAKLTSANGSFGTFSFTSATASNWLTNFVTTNTNGFLKIVAPTGVTTPPTDQAFLSRQQLISLTQSLNISPDFLQYMGTFSRALEQPSFAPNSSRPRIVSSGSAPPAASLVDTYLGNNDAQGGDDTINPSFLSIRVKTAFTRLNGATAVVGEPLVKTRFALSRLGLVTYTATASQTAGDPIYDRFGLYRSNASLPWTYNHGSNSILTLSAVANLSPAREPDFAELIKASICAGSLAKGGPNLHNDQGNYQYTIDTSLDNQILQIVANLIDQQDADSYPTVIQLPVGSTYYTVYGIEDLPYFYRFHLTSVVDRLPQTTDPAQHLYNSSSVTFPGQNSSAPFTTQGSTSMATYYPGGGTAATSWDATPSTNTSTTANGAIKGTLADYGEATYLYILDLWNPHAIDTLATSANSRPTKYRIFATTDDPLAQTPAWQIGVRVGFSLTNAILPSNDSTNTISIWPNSVPVAFTAANTALTFSDNGGVLFREPTLIWNTNPTGLSLAGAGSVTDINTAKTYYGIIAGKAPVAVSADFHSLPVQATDGTYTFLGNGIGETDVIPVGAFRNLSFFLQYQDPANSSNWITYDVKYSDLHGLNQPGLVVNTADFSNYMDPLVNYLFQDRVACFDPRTARWGIGTSFAMGQVSAGTSGVVASGTNPYLLEPTANSVFNNSYNSNIAAANTQLAATNFSVLETNRARADKGIYINYSNPGMTSDPGKNLQMRIFTGQGWASNAATVISAPYEWSGLLSQNNPAAQFFAKDGATSGQSIYFEDADGVARRAMGAYADATFTDSTTSSLAQPISSSPHRIGLPMATANTMSNNAVATGTAQGQSRSIILNRPFRSVSEMSYAFRGTPWKNIDFFTPESGDPALLDTFCLVEPPANAMIAGRVDLNTRQPLVLKAVVAGGYRDELNNVASPTSYALPPLNAAEAANVATKLTGITSDVVHAWHGPLRNISELVGRYVPTPGTTTGYTDFYKYTPPSPVTGQPTSITYAGLSAALDSTVYTNTSNSASASAPIIQRFREAGIRPMVDAGQVRVWNLLIDLVAQTGRYPTTATGLDQFLVEGQSRVWLHVAIDRYTGQILDKQVEVVTP